jgi:cell division protein ZapA
VSADQVSVRIFGEPYALRSGEDPAYVAEVAAYVDAAMREVAASGKVVVTTKVAVLAALHIADELLRLRRQAAGARGDLDARIAALAARLESALDRGGSPG